MNFLSAAIQVFLLFVTIFPNLLINSIPVWLSELEVDSTPIIGIVSTPYSRPINKLINSVISEDIVRFIEEGGAKIVPIHYKISKKDLYKLLPKINGIVFQGGGPKHWPQSELIQHFDTQYEIFKWAVNENNRNNSIPILGVCLGFQRIIEFMQLLNAEKNFPKDNKELYRIRNLFFGNERVNNNYTPGNLLLENNNTFILDSITDIIRENPLDKKEKIFFFNNFYGINSSFFQLNNISSDWNVIAYTKTRENKKIIAVIEGKKYPFYGIQFHPEKIQFSIGDHLKNQGDWGFIPKNKNAIIANSRISINFVDAAKKNNNKFTKTNDYETILIQNYRTYVHKGGDVSAYYAIPYKHENNPLLALINRK